MQRVSMTPWLSSSTRTVTCSRRSRSSFSPPWPNSRQVCSRASSAVSSSSLSSSSHAHSSSNWSVVIVVLVIPSYCYCSSYSSYSCSSYIVIVVIVIPVRVKVRWRMSSTHGADAALNFDQKHWTMDAFNKKSYTKN